MKTLIYIICYVERIRCIKVYLLYMIEKLQAIAEIKRELLYDIYFTTGICCVNALIELNMVW